MRALLALAGGLVAGCVSLVIGSANFGNPKVPLVCAALLAIAGIAIGVGRTKRSNHHIDVFHPLVFPLAYVAISFLAPAWAMFIDGKEFNGFTAADLDKRTPVLMFLAIAGIVFGLAAPFRRQPRSASYTAPVPDAGVQLLAGRLLLLLPLGFAARNYATNSVAVRGIDQTAVSGIDVVAAAAIITAPIALLLILNAHRARNLGRLLPSLDWVAILLFLGLTGLSGDRGSAIAVSICLLYAHTQRRGSMRGVIFGLAVLLVFSAAVATYRSIELNGPTGGTQTPFLPDWAVATYTVGITARGVPVAHGYAHGRTYLDSLERQLPSPIANRLFGLPYGSGNQVFRNLIGTDNPNMGYGYSLPAEGYLNFGVVGLFGASLLFGLAVSWAYSRRAWAADGTVALLYPVLVATMPLGIRSDSLGLIKGFLYPITIAAVVMIWARTVSARQLGSGAGSRSTVGQIGEWQVRR